MYRTKQIIFIYMTIKKIQINPANYTNQSSQKVGFVMHWMAGTLASTDRTFQDSKRKASAHFGIGADGTIHQYLDIDKIAWHAGDWEANKKYIGIEHEGGFRLANNQLAKPSKKCHEASIELITQLCRELKILKLEYKKNIFKHSDIKATQCCGSLDVDLIIREVNNNLNPPKPAEKPKAWTNPRGREEQSRFAYINDLNEIYNRWVESGKCDVEVANALADRDNEIKNLKATYNADNYVK
jgi:N-acetylmuramoyl-L-alanine amidase CwlA